jgi:hypothetical protein
MSFNGKVISKQYGLVWVPTLRALAESTSTVF